MAPPGRPGEAGFGLVIAILAGGQSRRMGRDKALLPVAGETLLSRTVRLCCATGQRVWVVGRAGAQEGPAGAEFYPDETVGAGPLGGLVTALRQSPGGVLALACDLPRLEEDALRWLLGQPRGSSGVATSNRGRIEPLFSIYDARCLPLCEAHLRSGKLALHAVIEAGIAAGSFTLADAPDWLSPCLANVNTPADLARLSP